MSNNCGLDDQAVLRLAREAKSDAAPGVQIELRNSALQA